MILRCLRGLWEDLGGSRSGDLDCDLEAKALPGPEVTEGSRSWHVGHASGANELLGCRLGEQKYTHRDEEVVL